MKVEERLNHSFVWLCVEMEVKHNLYWKESPFVNVGVDGPGAPNSPAHPKKDVSRHCWRHREPEFFFFDTERPQLCQFSKTMDPFEDQAAQCTDYPLPGNKPHLRDFEDELRAVERCKHIQWLAVSELRCNWPVFKKSWWNQEKLKE